MKKKTNKVNYDLQGLWLVTFFIALFLNQSESYTTDIIVRSVTWFLFTVLIVSASIFLIRECGDE